MSYLILHGTEELRAKNIFRLKRMYEADRVDACDVALKDGARTWRTVGDTLGLTFGFAPANPWEKSAPAPPPVPWWVVTVLGVLTFGYALSIIAVIQAVWSRKVERRWAPVLLALLSAMTPPVHVVWIVRSILQGAHLHLGQALLELLVGFVAAEIAAYVLMTLASLSIRRSLVRRFSEKGFRMSWLLTVSFSSVYVAYAIEDLWNSYH